MERIGIWLLGKTHPVYHGIMLAIGLYVAWRVTFRKGEE